MLSSMGHILTLDQGTTSSRALVISPHGKSLGTAQKEFPQYYPRPGWVEHDAREIWSTQTEVIEKVLATPQIRSGDLDAIGITNQRETTVLWDRKTGEPIHPAIVWQDRRTASACEGLRDDGHLDMFRNATGLVLDPYFSGTKIRWLLDRVPVAQSRAREGELAFGTIDSWLIWKLTDGEMHVIDDTNASRTLLYNLHTNDWDDELLAILDIPRALLPTIVPSSGVITEASWGPLRGVPIAGIAGDQQAALFGQACTMPGLAKNTYGTGCFLLMNTGSEPVTSGHQLLTTVAWRIGNQVTYALEGSVFSGGAVVQWLRDGLGLFPSAPDIEAMAQSVDNTGGVVFVPAFTGLGAPHWQPHARGTISGITRGTTAAHLARAALESIAFQVADLMDCMAHNTDMVLSELRVDGGASANNLLLQIQADVLNVPVVRPQQIESTAMGAAFLAGLATGVWDSTDDISGQWTEGHRATPAVDPGRMQVSREAWRHAVNATIAHAQP